MAQYCGVSIPFEDNMAQYCGVPFKDIMANNTFGTGIPIRIASLPDGMSWKDVKGEMCEGYLSNQSKRSDDSDDMKRPPRIGTIIVEDEEDGLIFYGSDDQKDSENGTRVLVNFQPIPNMPNGFILFKGVGGVKSNDELVNKLITKCGLL